MRARKWTAEKISRSLRRAQVNGEGKDLTFSVRAESVEARVPVFHNL